MAGLTHFAPEQAGFTMVCAGFRPAGRAIAGDVQEGFTGGKRAPFCLRSRAAVARSRTGSCCLGVAGDDHGLVDQGAGLVHLVKCCSGMVANGRKDRQFFGL
jgi:hypothetical protein